MAQFAKRCRPRDMACFLLLFLLNIPPDLNAFSMVVSDPHPEAGRTEAGQGGFFLPGGAGEFAALVFEEPDPPGWNLLPAAPDAGRGGRIEGLKQKPLIAIIIDDMGYHRRIGQALLEMDLNLTFSFLPHAPHTPEQAREAWRRGRDIMVHMPMEARDPVWNPGPGTLYLDDSPGERASRAAAALAMVPHAVGVNNHMGSRLTADKRAMSELMALIQPAGLFFVDSITTQASVALKTARELGIKAARRNVFLDNIQDEDEICRQLALLVDLAEQRGRAIGIGHPNQATLGALQRCREMLLSRTRMVNVRELVR